MLIAEYRVPFATAIGVVGEVTPALLVALIGQMSPQEVINHLGALKRRGAFDHDEVRALIERRIEAAQKDKRVSAMKVKVAQEAAGDLGEDVAEALADAADAQIKAKGRIERPTALLVDKSGSMEQALEVGKRLAAMISSIAAEDLFVWAFDTMPYAVEATGERLADWEAAFDGIRAGGMTSLGAPLEAMKRAHQYVEQIVYVTDEGDNTSPLCQDGYRAYQRAMNVSPDVVIVKVGYANDMVEAPLRQCGARVETYTFEGDYYALPNLVPMLSKASRLELLLEIMSTPLPRRPRQAA